MKENEIVDLVRLLREQGKITQEEVVVVEADVVIARNVITGTKRIVEHNLSTKRLLRG